MESFEADPADRPGTRRELTVAGAWTFTPMVHRDHRGAFCSPYEQGEHETAVGRRLFPLAQVSVSRSLAGVVRGIHFTRTPPGVAKYVHCSHGSVVDYVVDLRVGSPTFGAWDAVRLDAERGRTVYLPVGVGHAFAALTAEASMTYLLSGGYVPENELALTIRDPRIGLRLPGFLSRESPVLSERDRDAPTADRLLADGLLPEFRTCTALEAALGGRPAPAEETA
ncbi:dTDP-4-dehydrorhamnose 3,5-epimerase [Amycolatopsis sp. QT-25]|uniref:dTDP-4-dehydrorhamnose 3,5-epimerase family protein n=1 Tax=Amycolatopsis sp. QT-25 TaxID=3034022 RepID=UPI0023EBCF83|nr:dTDP-4-dehydrorhamnose 3,5-epimerase [Amycolatopsis sp. QT-25]WET76805.1 dTDP-4-dehydrorhamnose 3,5-epimerase [Amycolatopsis sp. QT-25]